MLVQIGSVAEMGIRHIAEGKIAFHHLHQVEVGVLPQPVEQVRNGREQVIRDKEQSQRARRRRNSHPLNSFRPRVVECRRKDRELMFLREVFEKPEMTAADRIGRYDFVIEDRNPQFTAPPLHSVAAL